MEHKSEQHEISYYQKLAQHNAKPCTCFFCGKAKEIINSHSVPRAVLKRIAEEGWILKHEALMNPTVRAERGDGINKAGSFWMLCEECDTKYFKHYENCEFGIEMPSQQILSEIALKNYLYQLSESRIEKETFRLLYEKYSGEEFFKNRMNVVDADIRHFSKKTEHYRKLVQKGVQNIEFEIMFYSLLPYRTQIAVQGQIPLAYDMTGQIINDNFDYFTQTHSMHVAVFPQMKNTAVIVFCEKGDNKYRRLCHQMKTSSHENNLIYINYIIFEYTDNVYISKTETETIRKNPFLSQIASENNGLPNLGGGVTTWEELETVKIVYQGPKPEDIPNFLSKNISKENIQAGN